MTSSALSFFHPLIRTWFTERVGTPTDIQELSWRAIRQGRHVLLTAPTGSGKTLAAFLWAINQLAIGAWPCGTVRVVYVSPMKALNNDVRRNLERPLREIQEYFQKAGVPFPEIRVQSRSGDTPASERRKMYRKPPEIFITTPESLNILVTSKSGRALLTGVAAVILDEIHAVLPDKRGTHLITAVDRLVLLAGEFQRIALSATVRPLQTVADFVGGSILLAGGGYEKRPVDIIRSAMVKELDVTVTLPPEAQANITDATWWPAMIKAFKDIITSHNSTLFFTNSRRHAEKVTRLINEDEPEELAYSHHGSLARELRLAVEQKLKNGELKAIVATNSLELGIDIGDLDRVVLIQSPPSVAHAIQRIGRSGHGVGDKSHGLLFPLHGKDFVHAAVLARAVREKDIEEVHPVENPLDVLAQVILAMVVAEKWVIDDLFDTIRTSFPYRNLTRHQFDPVLAMLAGRYADSKIRELRSRVHLDRLAGTIETKDGTAYLLYTSGGTIPDRGAYVMRHQETKARLGELDEEFVWERRLGETFALGAQIWRIQSITHNDVLVVPVSGSHNIIPFWKGEAMHRGFHLSERIGLFLETCNEALDDPALGDIGDIGDRLMTAFSMDKTAADYLQAYLRLQRQASGADLPHRHHLLIEHYDDPLNTADRKQVIIHTLWGGRVNYPFSLALAAAWQEKHGYPLQVFADNDCILLMLPHDFGESDLLTLVSSVNVEQLLRKKLEESGYFGAHFRENCGRALLLPKSSTKRRMPLWLNRLRSKKLLEAVQRYEDFPILLETWRECFHDHFDLANLKMLLDELEAGHIAVSEVVTHQPTPFADGVIWQQTNKYMYEDDTPDGSGKSSLSDTLIRELVFTSHLRPKLETGLIDVFLGKIQRTCVGYAPLHALDLIETVEERLLLPEGEWQELLQATVRDSGLIEEDLLQAICERVVSVDLPGAGTISFCTIERLPFIAQSLNLAREDVTVAPLAGTASLLPLIDRAYALSMQQPDDVPAGPETLLAAWLATRGPVTFTCIRQTMGLTEAQLDAALIELAESQQVVVDTFTSESNELAVCDTGNLEILLRMLRRARQAQFEPLDNAQLPLFLALHQGLTYRTNTNQALQRSLDTLFGCPAPCAAWEEYILPARLDPYYSSHLDSLLQATGLLWYGCGEKKITFAFAEDLELFAGNKETAPDVNEQLAILFPDPKGRYSFFDILGHSRIDSATLSEKLWSLVWQGYIGNDSYAVLRKGIDNNFKPQRVGEEIGRHSRRHAFSRWESSRPLSGPFFLLPTSDKERPADSLSRQETMKDRVRQLLSRYGIIFRDLLAKEQPELQWRNIYKTVRLMELSGEIVAGYFFEGIDGPQFISPEAYRMLHKELDQEVIFWLNACDPASLCGIGPESLRAGLPPRIPSTYLVYHGPRLPVIIRKNGRELDIFVPPGHPLLGRYLEVCRVLLTREFNPLKMIAVEKVNGAPSIRTEYLQDLKDFGFTASHRGLELRKRM
ncbi:MAG: ATP-dependent helicase [Desulfobulbaceae bacterium BRH_c16a]|nr:MAG: ATP-dependent helicase [Desulfobulbaceae bacterium BRH_c16a]